MSNKTKPIRVHAAQTTFNCIGEAVEVARKSFKTSNRQKELCVISAEKHDGRDKDKFCLAEWFLVAEEDRILTVQTDGDIREGPAAKRYPIGIL
jgi:hypothetical protein